MTRWLKSVSVLLTVLVFILVSLGGLVRNEGAGLSCPDWPLCFGKVVPPLSYQVFLEWFHRVIAGAVSVSVLVISLTVFSNRELREHFGRFCALALGLLFMQVILGGMTVLGLLAPIWVASHLAVGVAFFGTLLWMALHWLDFEKRPSILDSSRPAWDVRWGGIVLAIMVYGQIILGGAVSSTGSGLACLDFPTCNGDWFPHGIAILDGVGIQWLHRIGAGLVAVVALVVFALGRNMVMSRRYVSAVRILPWIVGVQLALGIGNVLLKLPVLMSVAHLAVAVTLFGTSLAVVYEVRRC